MAWGEESLVENLSTFRVLACDFRSSELVFVVGLVEEDLGQVGICLYLVASSGLRDNCHYF